MKKFLSVLLFLNLAFACNNSSRTTKISPDSGGAGNTPGIDNVNGNIPDTDAAIKLNKPLPKDSSGVLDSSQH